MTDQFTTAGLGDEIRNALKARGAHSVVDALSILDGETHDLANAQPRHLRAIVRRFAKEHPHLFGPDPDEALSPGQIVESVAEEADQAQREAMKRDIDFKDASKSIDELIREYVAPMER